MVRNYIKVAFRNILKDKFYSTINILGLSIGITACLLIMLYVTDELSFDKYHSDSERIYRVVAKARLSDEIIEFVGTPAPMTDEFKNTIPEVESVTRLLPLGMVFNNDGNIYKEDNLMYADSTFFDVFNYKLIQGKRDEALKEPNSIIITEDIALKYFGDNKIREGRILGSFLKANGKLYKVTGIMENIPANTHLRFDMLVSMSSYKDALNSNWLNMHYLSYVKLKNGISPSHIEEQITDIVIEKAAPQAYAFLHLPKEAFEDRAAANRTFKLVFQPITWIHLNSKMRGEIGKSGDMSYIYIFSAIAIFIIVIACINFINLSTARSAKRAMEVGVRKTLGSSNQGLIMQFMFESFVFTLIAMIIALGLVEAFKIPFNTITGKNVSLNVFNDPQIVFIIVGLTWLIGLLAGSYPAFYLSKYKPVDVMKGSRMNDGKGSWFRNSMVVFQFVISIGLIICTSLVYKQMHFISKLNLGYDRENVIVIPNAWALGTKMKAYKQELLQQQDILNGSFTYCIPSKAFNSTVTKAEGDLATDHQIFTNRSDYDFVNTMGMEIIAGRDFSRDFASDSSAVIVNEAAVKTLGWSDDNPEKAIGKFVEMMHGKLGSRIRYNVVGVVRDFNFETIKNEVRPMAIFLFEKAYYLTFKVKSNDLQGTIAKMEKNWKTINGETPFDYFFLDQTFDNLYQSEQKMGQIFGIFTSIAIFIACLGLFGLAAFTAEQKTKEIGIRKVMGASSTRVITMLNKQFIKLVAIALLISAPLAWYFMHVWLNNFAFKTEIGLWPFMLAALMALILTIATVGYQSFRAANANPVNSLRSE